MTDFNNPPIPHRIEDHATRRAFEVLAGWVRDQVGAVVSTLAGLTDTTISSPGSGEYLRHDGTDWKNANIQTSDLPTLPSHNHAASDVTSGTFASGRISQASVTQHQAALTILESQITDANVLARIAGTETITGTWTFSNRIAAPAAGVSIGNSDDLIRVDGGRLDFVLNGTVVASLDASGNFRALAGVFANSTP